MLLAAVALEQGTGRRITGTDQRPSVPGRRSTRQRTAVAALLEEIDELRTVAVTRPTVARWADRIAAEHGCTAVGHSPEIFGRCAVCAG